MIVTYRYRLIFLFLVVLLLGLSNWREFSQYVFRENEWVTYQSEAYDYRVSYPGWWIWSSFGDNGYKNRKYWVATVYPPFYSSEAPEYIAISRFMLSDMESLEERQRAYLIENFGDEYRPLEHSTIEIDDRTFQAQAYLINDTKWLDVFTAENPETGYITSVRLPDSGELNEQGTRTFYRIVGSFQIIE